MTQFIKDSGQSVAATVIEAGPCYVTQVKTSQPSTFQMGFGEVKKVNKPLGNHLKEKKLKTLREFKYDNDNQEIYQADQSIDLSIFDVTKPMIVTGTSKGKGFAGTTKRHNFKIGPKSHGSKNHRKPGSTGCRYPQRAVKGRKLPGRMGVDRTTVKNIQILNIEADKNLLVVAGCVPGNKGSILIIKQA